MGNRYWVGGTAAWDGTAGTKWALTDGGAGGQAVPNSSDDVFFTAASGAVTVTLSGTPQCNNLTCTGFTGTLTGTPTWLKVYGSLTLVSGMSLGGSIPWQFSGAGAQTITTAGKSMYHFLCVAEPATGVYTLQDALTATQLHMYSGTLKLKSGTTNTITSGVDGTINGTACTLAASTGGSATTLSCASGTVQYRHITITDSTATGGATFIAGPGATNGGGNTGWTFNPGNSGIFFGSHF